MKTLVMLAAFALLGSACSSTPAACGTAEECAPFRAEDHAVRVRLDSKRAQAQPGAALWARRNAR